MVTQSLHASSQRVEASVRGQPSLCQFALRRSRPLWDGRGLLRRGLSGAGLEVEPRLPRRWTSVALLVEACLPAATSCRWGALGRLSLGERANGSVLAGLWARLRRHDPQARPKRIPVRRTRPSRTVPSETKNGGNLALARTTAWACSCPWKCAIAWLVSRSASSLRVGDKAPFAAARVSASFAARFLFFVAFRWRESGALRYLGTAPPPCSLRCSRNSAISLRAAC